MSDSLEVIANTKKSFTILDKVYKVKRFNLFELSSVRQTIIDSLEAQYKKDVVELSVAVPDADRTKFILQALKTNKVNEESIRDAMMSRDGITKILSIALKLADNEILNLLANEDCIDVLLDIFKFVLDFKDETYENDENDKKDKNDKNDEKKTAVME